MRRILIAAVSAALFPAAALAGTPSVSSDEAAAIARDAYVYAYPLVLMDVSAKVSTNVVAPSGKTDAPVNQFGHARAFPDAAFTVVARPNADTLYSSLVFDVSKGPLIVTVPDSAGRYYLLPMLDKWSDVFASPGTRTTGNGAQTFAIVGPKWQGKLPPGVKRYMSPTAGGWIGGRVQTNGKSDYDAVHKFQDGIKAVPLAAYGKPYTPPAARVDAKLDMSAPPDQVDKMDAATFFAKFAELLKSQPPHANDYPILDRMKRIGIEPGRSFSLATEPGEIRDALNAAPALALAAIKAAWTRAGVLTNGWRTNLTAIGTYGTDYLHRAGVAYGGLGANVPEDAVYPTAFADAEGRPFESGKRYTLHFDKDQLPPVRGFWSLTMYDERQLFTANPIDRFAIGDRDKLAFNADGSLDLYIQREPPGKDKESNWLPTPGSGAFTMNLRLYWPKPSVLDGSWVPPSVWGLD
jgi:hypothetical protein